MPRPIARDRASGWAAYEWIAGDKVETVSDSDIDAAGGFAMALGGILRDVVASFSTPWTGYCFVYSIEWLLLLATLWVMRPLLKPWASAPLSQPHTDF